jgi:hypothetical protein
VLAILAPDSLDGDFALDVVVVVVATVLALTLGAATCGA